MMGEQKMAEPAGPWQDWGDGGISQAEFEAYIAKMQARQADAPAVGELAPDFEIERLDAQGKRTGTLVRLSSTRGKPVALIFGSYT